MSEIQSFILLLILHYAFDMFVSFVHYFLALYFAVYNNVAMFDLFQHVSKCIWNNFIDVIYFLFFMLRISIAFRAIFHNKSFFQFSSVQFFFEICVAYNFSVLYRHLFILSLRRHSIDHTYKLKSAPNKQRKNLST